jgi:hypothetical protein
MVLVKRNVFSIKKMIIIQMPVEKQLNKIVSNSTTNLDKLPLSKPIIKPWEEIKINKHINGLGYENYFTFHNPYYAKLIKFWSDVLLQ